MFIMHAHMIGIVISNPDFVKDSSGKDLWCSFFIRVDHDGEQIPFTVCVSDQHQIALCREQMARGSYVLIKGLIGVTFRSIQTEHGSLYPLISSSMHVICKEICVISCHTEKKATPSKNITLPPVASPNSMKNSKKNAIDELPF